MTHKKNHNNTTSTNNKLEKESSTTTTTTTTKDDKQTVVVNEKERKIQSFIVRAVWTFVMLFAFIIIILSGHLSLIILVIVLEALVFKECIAITAERAKKENLIHTNFLNWYFLLTTEIYLDGRTISKYFIEKILEDRFLPIGFAKTFLLHHKFICYCMYVGGFIFFVATLKKGHLKFQFAQLCITNMTLLLVILQGHCIVNNILHGLFWFLLPSLLVITNDIFAYICGITFGKTQLIAISPKKTVEGFVGAWICTTIAAVALSHILINYSYITCPVNDLSINYFKPNNCDPDPIFISQIYKVPKDFVILLGKEFITFKPIYFHSMILGMFASLIAPFGGFFASGLKRAFKIKDFGHTIPGHGGFTDRLDCQFMMGSFSYLYYETFISSHNVNVGNILQTIIINLSGNDILQLVKSLHSYLYKSGVINEETYLKLIEILQ
ncbi:hypothetical protein B5S28_g1770 [[Candida] boidinii]|nr:hypothetical protein B5S28_g1770 [[Candida] boidinii]OWB61211.1 hypothetical protein B5S29_g2098 [[Candida] boidinii]